MAYNIVMPQLSDAMEEGKLISWKVKPGDAVHQGDVIAEVESDKAIMEVQTFKDGLVKELRLKEGESAPVGSVIAVIETSAQSSVGSRQEESAEKKEETTPKDEEKSSQTNNTGSEQQTTQPPTTDDDRRTTPPEPSIVAELFGDSEKTKHSALRTQHPNGEAEASPRARALAAKLGLDIEALQKKGKLPIPAHAEEVRRYWERRYFTPKALKLLEEYGLSTSLFAPGKKHTEKEILAYIEAHDIPRPKPLSPMRKAIVATVTEAQKRPVFHIYDHLDATLLKKHESERHTITVWLIKLFGKAMMRHEAVRTTFGENGLRVWPGASLSVAMAHGEALYMPVFRHIERKSIDEIADELKALKEKVRSGRIRPEALRGSTFGLSNLGMTGVERFDAMVGGDDAGIAAIGAEKEGRIAVTLTLDHRIINGWQGAEFMQTLKTLATDETLFKE
ncbi:dihydrolipoamide acetyltransferase family protein [Hydrogenimonas sp.]